MASAFCEENAVDAGVVAGPRPADGASLPRRLEWIDAAHPLPDPSSARAARSALALAARARGDGTLVVLLSGGASSMLAAPAGIGLAEKGAAASALMAAGVGIAGLNCVRKHLSSIKGGWLAAAARTSVTLALSDVHTPVEDDPAVIGSGPTSADPSTYAEALGIITASGVRVPAAVLDHLSRGVRGEIAETPKPGDPRLARASFHVIGSRRTALAGAEAAARRLGYAVRVIEAPTSGEARDAALAFVRSGVKALGDSQGPVCVIGAGETTVTVRGDGSGGRNQEFVLAAVPLVAGFSAAVLASVGTDGIDGPTTAAGAIADETSAQRAADAGLDQAESLSRNDAHGFFRSLNDLIEWGPTGTNVGDVHVLLLESR